MADEELQQEENEKSEEVKKDETKKSKLPWILLGIIVPLCAGSGFFLGNIMAVSKEVPEETEVVEEDKPDYMKILNDKASAENTWVFSVEPMVANLKDDSARRYLRVGFNLEISGQFEEVAGTEYLKKKKYLIDNWLGLYFSNMSVADLQGERNLRSILAQVKDGINEILFPDVKPLIVNVLFSERAIQ